MYIPKFSTFDSIVKPLKKIKGDLKLYKKDQEIKITSLHAKARGVATQIKTTRHEIDKSDVVIRKVTDFLGE